MYCFTVMVKIYISRQGCIPDIFNKSKEVYILNKANCQKFDILPCFVGDEQ